MQQSDAMSRVETSILDQICGSESYSVTGPANSQHSVGFILFAK